MVQEKEEARTFFSVLHHNGATPNAMAVSQVENECLKDVLSDVVNRYWRAVPVDPQSHVDAPAQSTRRCRYRVTYPAIQLRNFFDSTSVSCWTICLLCSKSSVNFSPWSSTRWMARILIKLGRIFPIIDHSVNSLTSIGISGSS